MCQDNLNCWIVDTTLRDGEQAPGVAFTPDQKFAIATALAAVGVDEIEVGTPAMGPAERQTIAQIVDLNLPVRLTAWCRARKQDMQWALSTGVKSVHLSLPVSQIHLRAIGKDMTWVYDELHELVPWALSHFEYVSVGAQDASRADARDLRHFVAEVRAVGAHRVRIADTVGVWHPMAAYEACFDCVDAAREMTVGVHMHNDLGMALANSVMALEAGVSSVDTTVLGLGERAGNVALEQLIMSLQLRRDTQSSPHHLDQLPGICKLVSQASGRPIPVNQPVVGERVFSHESGIHVHAMLRDTTAYEPFEPGMLGLSRQYVIGKHSGTAALKHVLASSKREALGETQLIELLSLIREAASELNRGLTSLEVCDLYDRFVPNTGHVVELIGS
ncbi:MAG: homocitrate synthase [Phycisphaeraceae bacterium JB051]